MQFRIPYTSPLPSFPPLPSNATTLTTAIRCVANFLRTSPNTLILSGAGISVESGLPDYRGSKGTYTLNRDYKPVFYSDFVNKDYSRRRYWARSFLGWRGVEKVLPNRGHIAVGRMWEGGWVNGVITQNVDSLHSASHPLLPVTNLHGTLATLTCLTCHTPSPRSPFQAHLEALNPTMTTFRDDIRYNLELDIKTNPDGDIDVPGAPYSSFRYPPCLTCLNNPSTKDKIKIDDDGAMVSSTTAVGVMKPTVVFFGESLPHATKSAAEDMVDSSSAIMVLGSSLATYSANRLVKLAKAKEKKIGIINLGGVRGEDGFWDGGVREILEKGDGTDGFRVEFNIGEVLEGALELLEKEDVRNGKTIRIEPESLKMVEMYAP